MPKESIKTVYQGGVGEIIEKKSRFIASVIPIESEEEALSYIEQMKKKYWDASHNCSAYTYGENHEQSRCSDDGEPSKTAGRPMLDVLLGEDLHNVCVVVTRYFGGTLLGTGGLVRAYQQATKEGLANSTIIEKTFAKKLQIQTDYNGIGKIQYIIGQQELKLLTTEYTDSVTMYVLIPPDKENAFIKKVVEATSNRAVITELNTLYYADINGELVLFPS